MWLSHGVRGRQNINKAINKYETLHTVWKLVLEKRACSIKSVVMKERKPDSRRNEADFKQRRTGARRDSENTTDTLPRQCSPTIIQGNICFIIGPISIYRPYPPSVCSDGPVLRSHSWKKELGERDVLKKLCGSSRRQNETEKHHHKLTIIAREFILKLTQLCIHFPAPGIKKKENT